MINISCIGHYKVLDQGLEKKITASLKKLLSQDNSLNFYFFLENEFTCCVNEAVRQFKIKHKDLQIKTIWVDTHKKGAKAYKKYDETMFAPNLLENVHFMVNVRRVHKWVIEQADYLFMYLYPGVIWEEQLIVSFIEKQVKASKLAVIDLTRNSTVSLINEQQVQLPAKLSFVHGEILSGKSFSGLAEEMNVSPSYVRQQYNAACHKLFALTYRTIQERQEDNG